MDQHGSERQSSLTSTEVPCNQCKQPIPAGARLCAHCNSYQDWRSYLSFSSTVLALLVALFTILTSAAPVAIKELNSRSRTSAHDPILEGRVARLVMSNTGENPSILNLVDVEPKLGEIDTKVYDALPVKQVRFRLVDKSAGLLIPKGNTQFVLEAIPWDPYVNAEQAASAAKLLYDQGIQQAANALLKLGGILGGIAPKEGEKSEANAEPYSFDISVVESNGEGRWISLPFNTRQMSDLLFAHAEYCRSLREVPSRTNGCVSGDQGR
jgi:hypothetical protein